MRHCAASLLLLGVAWAGGLVIQPAPATEAPPGAYVTLLFTLTGEGAVRPQVDAPEGWQALPTPEQLQLGENTFLVVTVRVPELTPAGSVHPVTLRLWEGERLLAEASTRVGVLARADLILYAEEKEEARMGEPVSYRITVVNRGNQRDRITLEATANTGEAHLQPRILVLDPGQEGSAVLTLQIGADRKVSPGYTMLTWVRARSGNAPLERKVRLTTRWIDPFARGTRRPDPTLRIALSGSLGVSTQLIDDRFSEPVFRYSIQPALDGSLSDFVETSLRSAPLKGRSPSWWPADPSGINLGLKATSWDAALSASKTAVALRAGLKSSSWRYGLGVSSRYDLGSGGLSVQVVSTRRPLNLQLAAGTELAQGSRRDRFSIDYGRTLNRALSLRLGGRLNGIHTNDYTLIGTARQGLLWQGTRFSVLQSLSSSPQLGLHTLTLAGGTRSVYPLGARLAAHLQLRPEGVGWKASGSIFAAPLPRSSLHVGAVAEQAAGLPLEFSLNPSLSLRPPELAGVRSGFSVGYKLGYTPANGDMQQIVTLSTRLGYGGFSLSGSGTYTLVGARSYGARVDVRWQPSPLTQLEAKYAVKLADTYSETAGAGWKQYWGAGFASGLELERSEGDRLNLYLVQSKLLQSSIALRVGYTVSDPDGLGRGSEQLTHGFSVQLGYNLAGHFPTPEPLVNLFGGRKVGRVEGVAFIDTNLNQLRDDGEPVVPGLTVRLGDASGKTDKDGRYQLLARPGRHAPKLGNLPATLDLYQTTELQVEVGRRHQLDLPLAPTAQVFLVLFRDANRNGVQDEGEPGIPYGGVRLQGPSSRSFRSDDRGRVLATGLLPGLYQVAPDDEMLPPRYEATSPPIRVLLRAGKREGALRIGAAPPPKQVRTTYDAGKLAVFANLPAPIIAAGSEFEVRAIAIGEPERVWVELEGTAFPLQLQADGSFTARLRLPTSTPTGTLMLKVNAAREAESATTLAMATVVRRPLYELEPLKLQQGRRHEIELKLLFQATTVQLVLGGGSALEMVSNDGYRWFAEWTPQQSGVFEAYVVADGEELSPTRITIRPRETEEQ